MTHASRGTGTNDAAQCLIEELLRTAFSLGSIYAPLLAIFQRMKEVLL